MGAAAAAMMVAVALVTAAAPAWAGGRAAPQRVDDLPAGKLKQQLQTTAQRATEAGYGAGLIKHPVAEALRAFERARGAIAAGDQLHAAQLRALADRWAQLATTLVRAAAAEKKADQQQKRAQQLNTKRQRAQLLLAEQQASLGRLRAALKAAEQRLEKQRQSNAAAEAARVTGDDNKAYAKRRKPVHKQRRNRKHRRNRKGPR